MAKCDLCGYEALLRKAAIGKLCPECLDEWKNFKASRHGRTYDVRLTAYPDKIWAEPLTPKAKKQIGEGMGYYFPFWTPSSIKTELAYSGLTYISA